MASTTEENDPDFSTPFLIELRKVFDMFDEDSDGGLSCSELEKVFRQLGLEGQDEGV
jgi:Ca2+-binding EF-hand superfamily protein